MDKGDKIFEQLNEILGDDRIVVALVDGHTYVDIPEDPEVFAKLMTRIHLTIGMKDLDRHAEAYARKIEELRGKIRQAMNKTAN